MNMYVKDIENLEFFLRIIAEVDSNYKQLEQIYSNILRENKDFIKKVKLYNHPCILSSSFKAIWKFNMLVTVLAHNEEMFKEQLRVLLKDDFRFVRKMRSLLIKGASDAELVHELKNLKGLGSDSQKNALMFRVFFLEKIGMADLRMTRGELNVTIQILINRAVSLTSTSIELNAGVKAEVPSGNLKNVSIVNVDLDAIFPELSQEDEVSMDLSSHRKQKADISADLDAAGNDSSVIRNMKKFVEACVYSGATDYVSNSLYKDNNFSKNLMEIILIHRELFPNKTLTVEDQGKLLTALYFRVFTKQYAEDMIKLVNEYNDRIFMQIELDEKDAEIAELKKLLKLKEKDLNIQQNNNAREIKVKVKEAVDKEKKTLETKYKAELAKKREEEIAKDKALVQLELENKELLKEVVEYRNSLFEEVSVDDFINTVEKDINLQGTALVCMNDRISKAIKLRLKDSKDLTIVSTINFEESVLNRINQVYIMYGSVKHALYYKVQDICKKNDIVIKYVTNGVADFLNKIS